MRPDLAVIDDPERRESVNSVIQTAGFGTGNTYALAAPNVWADNAADSLTGNSGADWYLADLADLLTTTGGGDSVTRFQARLGEDL